MKYKFQTAKHNYEDFAAGRVIMTYPGATSFPVRLASEIFQHCAAHLSKPKLRLYDPCCGGGYLLSALGFLHGDRIQALYASDIDSVAVEFARRNLALLSAKGLHQRQREIEAMLRRYGKPSHADALTSLKRLRPQLPNHIQTAAWVADAMRAQLAPRSIDLLITDVPYGEISGWINSQQDDPIHQLLDAHYATLARSSIAAIISDKSQKAAHPHYRRVQHFTHGKRRITLLEPV